ncbi:MAG: hypothetical protein EOP68_08140, partial [Sphingomonas sp.]
RAVRESGGKALGVGDPAILKAVERHRRRIGEFRREAGASRQRPDRRDHRLDRLGRAGDRAVDPLARDQQRAPDPQRPRARLQRRADRRRVVERGEAVERRDADHSRSKSIG